MSLSDLASIGSFVSGFAVLLSLVYLASQVRQGTKATRSEIHQNILTGWLSTADLVTQHADVFARGLTANAEKLEAMSDAEKLIFVTVAMAMFRHYENVFLQNREGYVRSEDWDAWTRHLLMYFSMPGVQYWWKMRRSSFSPSFVAFLESSPPSSMPAPTDLFGARHNAH
ncbi:MAG TPA: hypothetical protein VJ476_10015 [Rhizomicrobium sp.]|nr:hypothetical protein [Rhizomicrobium sp.]